MSVEKSNLNDLQVMLESDVDVYGLQFDLNYDASHLQLTETNITHLFTGSDVRSNMSVYSRLRSDGSVRVIMFDLSGQPIVSSNNVGNKEKSEKYINESWVYAKSQVNESLLIFSTILTPRIKPIIT